MFLKEWYYILDLCHSFRHLFYWESHVRQIMLLCRDRNFSILHQECIRCPAAKIFDKSKCKKGGMLCFKKKDKSGYAIRYSNLRTFIFIHLCGKRCRNLDWVANILCPVSFGSKLSAYASDHRRLRAKYLGSKCLWGRKIYLRYKPFNW